MDMPEAGTVDESRRVCDEAIAKFNNCLETTGGPVYQRIIGIEECSDSTLVWSSDYGIRTRFKTWATEYLKCEPIPAACRCTGLGAWESYRVR